ncbi:hypothetical protein M514_07965 [Trichuris suis]|uniref:Uncharacterized protein n=1 Tax=Trichuris suis TaxID=68888 RepID=A0A085MRD7_9BILA|nr:hypothetical protein M513_07965 [Trichuris suis]KFD59783.1 hypothetical protein M514_07965 [Trichuris suis]
MLPTVAIFTEYRLASTSTALYTDLTKSSPMLYRGSRVTRKGEMIPKAQYSCAEDANRGFPKASHKRILTVELP